MTRAEPGSLSPIAPRTHLSIALDLASSNLDLMSLPIPHRPFIRPNARILLPTFMLLLSHAGQLGPFRTVVGEYRGPL